MNEENFSVAAANSAYPEIDYDESDTAVGVSINNTVSNTLISGGEGNDRIANSGTTVTIAALDGDDFIINGEYETTLVVNGTFIDGGNGNDTIYNNRGDSVTIDGGAGDDSINNDINSHGVSIDGGDGNDYIINSGDSVSIYGGGGNDTIDNYGSSASIDGGNGDDIISLYSSYYRGEVTISGGGGNDTIYMNNRTTLGNVYQYNNGDGNDLIRRITEYDTIQFFGSYTSSTVDTDVILSVGDGRITVVGGAGVDFTIAEGESDTAVSALNINNTIDNTLITGTALDDTIVNNNSNVTINADGGNDDISNHGKGVIINAGDGADSIVNSANNVEIDGGADADYIGNVIGNNITIDGGSGSDTIWSGGMIYVGDSPDSDTYFYPAANISINGGAGSDIISLNAGKNITIAAPQGNDTLYGYSKTTDTKIQISSYTATLDGSNVILTTKDGTLTIIDGKDATLNLIDSAGTLTQTVISAAVSEINNTVNNTLISGTKGDDTISNSGTGVTISALAGGDFISNFGSSVSVDANNGDDTIYNGGEYVKISGGSGSDSIFNFQRKVTISGGVGNDTISNHAAEVLVSAEGGNDVIISSVGQTTVNGGDGDDFISLVDGDFVSGGNGRDSILVGSNSSVDGGSGNDAISLRSAGSNITVAAPAGRDTLFGYAAASKVVLQFNGTGSLDGGNVILTAKGGSLTIIDGKDAALLIADSDGTVTETIIGESDTEVTALEIENTIGNTLISGTDENDSIVNSGTAVTIVALGGDDSIRNAVSNVIIDGGDGDDTIENNGGSVSIDGGDGDDTIENNGWQSYVNGGAGNDSIDNFGKSATLNGGSGNDSIWNRGVLSVSIDGGDGDDFISLGVYAYSYSSSVVGNTLKGGSGNDTIYMNGAATIGNVYQYSSGDGNDIVYNITKYDSIQISDYTTSVSGNDLIISQGDGRITVVGGKNVNFTFVGSESESDTEVSALNIENTVDNTLISGTDENDSISNLGDNVTIDGGAGDDSIYNEGMYSAIYSGDGDDTIENNAHYSTVDAGDGNNVVRTSGEGGVIITGSGDDLVFDENADNFISTGAGDDTIYHDFGVSTIDAGAGNDVISLESSYRNAFVVASAGDDTIYGYTTDTAIQISDYTATVDGDNVIFTTKDGTLTIIEGKDATLNLIDSDGTLTETVISDAPEIVNDTVINGTSKADTLQNAGSNVTINALASNDLIENSGSDVIINTGAGNNTVLNSDGSNITVNGGDGANFISIYGGSENVEVSLGKGANTVYSGGKNISAVGGSGAEVFIFEETADGATVDANRGNDLIQISGKNISATGGKGTDTISIGSSAENLTISSGEGNGNIIFSGNTGNLIQYESGADTISGIGGENTLQSAGAIETVTISGSNILLSFADKNNSITFENTPSLSLYVDQNAQTGKMVVGSTKNISGSADAESIFAFRSKATIDGGGGADTIYGYSSGSTILAEATSGKVEGENVVLSTDGGEIVIVDAADMPLNLSDGSGGNIVTVVSSLNPLITSGGTYSVPATFSETVTVQTSEAVKFVAKTSDASVVSAIINSTNANVVSELSAIVTVGTAGNLTLNGGKFAAEGTGNVIHADGSTFEISAEPPIAIENATLDGSSATVNAGEISLAKNTALIVDQNGITFSAKATDSVETVNISGNQIAFDSANVALGVSVGSYEIFEGQVDANGSVVYEDGAFTIASGTGVTVTRDGAETPVNAVANSAAVISLDTLGSVALNGDVAVTLGSNGGNFSGSLNYNPVTENLSLAAGTAFNTNIGEYSIAANVGADVIANFLGKGAALSPAASVTSLDLTIAGSSEIFNGTLDFDGAIQYDSGAINFNSGTTVSFSTADFTTNIAATDSVSAVASDSGVLAISGAADVTADGISFAFNGAIAQADGALSLQSGTSISAALDAAAINLISNENVDAAISFNSDTGFALNPDTSGALLATVAAGKHSFTFEEISGGVNFKDNTIVLADGAELSGSVDSIANAISAAGGDVSIQIGDDVIYSADSDATAAFSFGEEEYTLQGSLTNASVLAADSNLFTGNVEGRNLILDTAGDYTVNTIPFSTNSDTTALQILNDEEIALANFVYSEMAIGGSPATIDTNGNVTISGSTEISNAPDGQVFEIYDAGTVTINDKIFTLTEDAESGVTVTSTADGFIVNDEEIAVLGDETYTVRADANGIIALDGISDGATVTANAADFDINTDEEGVFTFGDQTFTISGDDSAVISVNFDSDGAVAVVDVNEFDGEIIGDGTVIGGSEIENSDSGVVDGTKFADSINNTADDVTIDAGTGADSIVNENANYVYIDGGIGHNTIRSSGAFNTIIGGGDDDFISFYGNNNTISSGFGNDTIEYFSGFGTFINSGFGNNYLSLGEEVRGVTISAGFGNSTLAGYNQFTTLMMDAFSGAYLIGENLVLNFPETTFTILNGKNAAINLLDSLGNFTSSVLIGEFSLGGGEQSINGYNYLGDGTVAVSMGAVTLSGDVAVENPADSAFAVQNGSVTLANTTFNVATDATVALTEGGFSVNDETVTVSGAENYSVNVDSGLTVAGVVDGTTVISAAPIQVQTADTGRFVFGDNEVSVRGDDSVVFEVEGSSISAVNDLEGTISGDFTDGIEINEGTKISVSAEISADGSDISINNDSARFEKTTAGAVTVGDKTFLLTSNLTTPATVTATDEGFRIGSEDVSIAGDSNYTVESAGTGIDTVSGVSANASVSGSGAYAVETDRQGRFTFGGSTYTVSGDDSVVFNVNNGAVNAVNDLEGTISGAFDLFSVNGAALQILNDDEVNVSAREIRGLSDGADVVNAGNATLAATDEEGSFTIGDDNFTIAGDNSVSFVLNNGTVAGINGVDNATITFGASNVNTSINGAAINLSFDNNDPTLIFANGSLVAAEGISEISSVAGNATVHATGNSTVNGVAVDVANDDDFDIVVSDGAVAEIININDGASLNVRNVTVNTAEEGAFAFGAARYTITGDDSVNFELDDSGNVVNISNLTGGVHASSAYNASINGVGVNVSTADATIYGGVSGISNIDGLGNRASVSSSAISSIVLAMGGSADSVNSSLTANDISFELSNDEDGVIIRGAVIDDLAAEASLKVDSAGTYNVNGTALDAKINDIFIGTDEGSAYIYDPENVRITANTSTQSILEQLGVASGYSYIATDPAIAAAALRGDLDGNMMLALSTSTSQTADFSNSTGRKLIELYDGDQLVRFNDEGSNVAVVAEEANGNKTIDLGDGGDIVVVEDSAANVSVSAGTGDDTIISKGDDVTVNVENSGAARIVANDGTVVLQNYDANSGAGIQVNSNDIFKSVATDNIQFGDGRISLDSAEVVVNPNADSTGGNIVNLYDNSGESHKLGFTNSNGGTLDASTVRGEMVLVGGSNGTSTIRGGTGDNTIIAGGNDYIDAGDGTNYVTLNGSAGATIAMTSTSGRTTVDGFNSGFDGDNVSVNPDSAEISFDGSDVTIRNGRARVTLNDVETLGSSSDANDDFANVSYTKLLLGTVKTAVAEENAAISVSEEAANKYVGSESGLDFVDYTGDVNVNLSTGRGTVGSESATFSGFNRLRAGSGTTTLHGSDSNETIYAGKGNATIDGGAGRDTLIGYSGDDKTGATTFLTTEGRATVDGFTFLTESNRDTADILSNGSQNVSGLQINDGDVIINLQDGSMTLLDGVGKDIRYGDDVVAQLNSDSLNFDGMANYFEAFGKNATVSADSSLAEVEIWLNNRKDETFYGDIKYLDASNVEGDVSLVGNDNNNVITAGRGDSSLWGGDNGDDTLIAGDGSDLFWYEIGNGNDIIEGASANDTVHLGLITLDMITNIDVADNSIKVNFNDGGTLTVNTNNGNTFVLSDDTAYVYDKSDGSWKEQ